MKKKPKPPELCEKCPWWLTNAAPRFPTFPGRCGAPIEVIAKCVDYVDKPTTKLSCNKKE